MTWIGLGAVTLRQGWCTQAEAGCRRGESTAVHDARIGSASPATVSLEVRRTVSARTRDLWVGVGTAVLFAYLLLVVIPNQIRTPASIANIVMSPAFWPAAIAVLAIVLGLALAAKAFITGSADDDGESSPTTWRSLASIGIMIGYYLLLEPLGIVLASVIAMPALSALFGERRVVMLAPIALLLPVGLYFFFTEVAHIPMPLGPLSDLI